MSENDNVEIVTCDACMGSGMEWVPAGHNQFFEEECGNCRGHGFLVFDHGLGLVFSLEATGRPYHGGRVQS